MACPHPTTSPPKFIKISRIGNTTVRSAMKSLIVTARCGIALTAARLFTCPASRSGSSLPIRWKPSSAVLQSKNYHSRGSGDARAVTSHEMIYSETIPAGVRRKSILPLSKAFHLILVEIPAAELDLESARIRAIRYATPVPAHAAHMMVHQGHVSADPRPASESVWTPTTRVAGAARCPATSSCHVVSINVQRNVTRVVAASVPLRSIVGVTVGAWRRK
jgi:hypothetical protein